MQLVDEQNHRAVGILDLFKNRLQTLFKLTAVLGPGDERAQIERDDLFVFQAFGNVVFDDTQSEPLGDRRFPDPRFPDQDGVVLRPARKDLDDPADFGVTADHRVEFSLRGTFGQVGSVFAQRTDFPLRFRIRNTVIPPNAAERL